MAGYGHNKSTKKAEAWNVRDSKVRPKSSAKNRVDLDPLAFDELITTKGVIIKIYRTTYCPRVKSVDGGEHEIDCPLCHGSNFVDLDALETTALIMNQDLEVLQNPEGTIDGNTVMMSFPIGVELQYFTKVELLDFTDIFIQRVMRAPDTDVDVLKYNAKRVNILIDFNGTRYYQDQDFKIDVNGNIKWTGLSRPADNLAYSVHYEAPVQYRATKAMHVARYTQRSVQGGVEHLKLQEQWLMTKEFLVKRKDQDGDLIQEGPFSNHTVIEED